MESRVRRKAKEYVDNVGRQLQTLAPVFAQHTRQRAQHRLVLFQLFQIVRIACQPQNVVGAANAFGQILVQQLNILLQVANRRFLFGRRRCGSRNRLLLLLLLQQLLLLQLMLLQQRLPTADGHLAGAARFRSTRSETHCIVGVIVVVRIVTILQIANDLFDFVELRPMDDVTLGNHLAGQRSRVGPSAERTQADDALARFRFLVQRRVAGLTVNGGFQLIVEYDGGIDGMRFDAAG